jgi:hypothetical protein
LKAPGFNHSTLHQPFINLKCHLLVSSLLLSNSTRACYKQGKLRAAAREFTRALKMDPNHSNAGKYLQVSERA